MWSLLLLITIRNALDVGNVTPIWLALASSSSVHAPINAAQVVAASARRCRQARASNSMVCGLTGGSCCRSWRTQDGILGNPCSEPALSSKACEPIHAAIYSMLAYRLLYGSSDPPILISHRNIERLLLR